MSLVISPRFRSLDRTEKDPVKREAVPVTNHCLRCGSPTSAQKPYCLAHVSWLPGAQAAAALLERVEREDARVLARRRIRVDTVRGRDILNVLRRDGALSFLALQRNAGQGISSPGFRRYLGVLGRAGLVRLDRRWDKRHGTWRLWVLPTAEGLTSEID